MSSRGAKRRGISGTTTFDIEVPRSARDDISGPFEHLRGVAGMKYLCMGFHDEKAWAAMDPARRDALTSESLEFESRLRSGGHVADSRALMGTADAITLRFATGGRVAVTDGPFAET